MVIEIDQSIKIEQTGKDTVVAFSNHIAKSILLPAREKREIQEVFRKMGKRHVFVYRTFAILIFLLIRAYARNIDMAIIDIEYCGQEHLIKNYLVRSLRKAGCPIHPRSIIFRTIGKSSRAHHGAYNVGRGKQKADVVATAADIFRCL